MERLRRRPLLFRQSPFSLNNQDVLTLNNYNYIINELKLQLYKQTLEGGEIELDAQNATSKNIFELKIKYQKWDEKNINILKNNEKSNFYINEYLNNIYIYDVNKIKIENFLKLKHEIYKNISVKNSILEYIIEKLSKTDLKETIESMPKQEKPISSSKVFIVHGHDNEAIQELARFLSKIELEPIILHERANSGKTIIKKFEDNSEVGFAIVLLTPDDEAYPKGKIKEKKFRARQNVVFEFGYFLAKLGEHRVCALNKGGVEIPSDLQGVIYIPMDGHGGWKAALIRELKAAGLEIDANKAF
jgi:predicted nucleotide-binding protein